MIEVDVWERKGEVVLDSRVCGRGPEYISQGWRRVTLVEKPAEMEALSKWRPIESAPLTSKSRLVWCPERRNIYVVSWHARIDPVDADDASEWAHFGGGNQTLLETPTHWLPLPPPPTEAQESPK